MPASSVSGRVRRHQRVLAVLEVLRKDGERQEQRREQERDRDEQREGEREDGRRHVHHVGQEPPHRERQADDVGERGEQGDAPYREELAPR